MNIRSEKTLIKMTVTILFNLWVLAQQRDNVCSSIFYIDPSPMPRSASPDMEICTGGLIAASYSTLCLEL